jgi:uncharacterized protein (TIGR00290 family)
VGVTLTSSSVALSWSGGKDSVLALRALRDEHGLNPRALITTVTSGYDRISMHGVRRSLLARQADAFRLPLVEVAIPPGCANTVYEERWLNAFESSDLAGVDAIAFGDLFLEDVRGYREALLARAGRRGLFPLWGRETARLASEFVAVGFRAVVVCVDPNQLDCSFAGREFDASLLAELPATVDPCGELGEFHTFVYAGPGFSETIECRVGEVVERDGFVFSDLTAA